MAYKKIARLHIKDQNIIKLLKENPEGLRARTLRNLLKINSRTLYNHLRSLEKRGIVKNIYPIWKIGIVQTHPEIWQTTLTSNKEQGHHILFILPLIKKPVWWQKRKDRLMKLKGWHYKKEVTANNNIYHQIESDSMQIQLYKNSIYFICREKYIANTPIEVFLKAKDDVLEAIRFLEERFRFKLIIEGNEHLIVHDGHYLTYQDALAELCKKVNDRFNIKTKEGYNLWVDFSDPLGTESNNPEVKRRYLIDIKDRQDNPEIPVASKIWELTADNTKNMNVLSKSVNAIIENQKGLPLVINDLKKQIESHLALIKEYRTENIKWREETEKKIKKRYSDTQLKLDGFLKAKD